MLPMHIIINVELLGNPFTCLPTFTISALKQLVHSNLQNDFLECTVGAVYYQTFHPIRLRNLEEAWL